MVTKVWLPLRGRWLRRVAWSAVGSLLVASCTRSGGFPPPCGPGVSRGDCYRSSPLLPCDPAEEVSRSAARLGEGGVRMCTTLVDGVPEQVWVASVGAAAPASREALTDALSRADWRVNGLSNLHVGECCAGRPELCIRFALERCTTPLDAVVTHVSKFLEADRALAKSGLALSVHFGAVGGRCPKAVSCPPIAYDASAPRYDANRTRYLASGVTPSLHECQTDGDCVRGGCGQTCDSWLTPRHVSTCQESGENQGKFCGCVSGECRWFEQ